MNDDSRVAAIQVFADAAAGSPATASERSPLLDAKIVMVDDEPLMTDLIQAHLEEEGYVNFVASNDPREAIALLRREDAGLLLLDLMMPGVSGFDVLEAIRADEALRYLPVIVLTASTGADSKLRALQLGATDFLAKPVDPSELALRVRNTLAFRQYHERMIHFDAVTGLPNERLFERGVDRLLARREDGDGHVALLSLTVPEWTQLRESVGDAAADTLARQLARRLERFVLREHPGHGLDDRADGSPCVARMAGGQFGVLLQHLPRPEDAEAAARRLISVLSEPVTFGAHDVVPSPWIGIALAQDAVAGPAAASTAGQLRQGAELAATHAQREGTAQVMFSSTELNVRTRERITLGSQLRNAARRGELRLHYQPKVTVAENTIIGGEALVRWQHPEAGLLPPGRFIGLAEELGIIGTIGEWVLQQACRDAAEWTRAGLGRPRIAVNVAKPQFAAGDLDAVLRRALDDTGLAPEQLVIELTESMLMEDAQASLALMGRIRDLGITLSIDDFGTGYSSLSYLKRFPLDELKIDRSFVMDLPGGRADAAIVRSVVDLGRHLGMKVIAEGVETPAQLACLHAFGCDAYQGYLFSRPVPPEEFARALARAPASAPPLSTFAP